MTRDAILSALRERILAFATSRIGRDEAQDLVQEVLLVLHEKYPEVGGLTDLVPLAFQILRFKMVDAQRKRARRGEDRQVPIEDTPVADSRDDPYSAYSRKQMEERLAQALRMLGPRCRKLFRLKLEGKSFPQIQILMRQESINTVYTWDHRCRKELLAEMGDGWTNAPSDGNSHG
ncbi:MAG: RNA polymerase sigma factor [Nitrospiraceae bacterium]